MFGATRIRTIRSTTHQQRRVVMSAVLETHHAPIVGDLPASDEVREAALDRAVAELAAEGWEPETKPDVERVLVGHNRFRRILVRRQLHVRNVFQLVEVDKRGTVSIRRV
jgi:hypothetical protein